MNPLRHIISTTALLLIAVEHPVIAAAEPWEKARALEDFPSLLGRSPFSLPTAEEKVTLDDRFHLAGAATMGGEQVVFVCDKNTHQRLLLRTDEDGSGNKLVEFLNDPNPKNMRAKVQIAGQNAEIRFSDTVFDLSQAPQPPAANVLAAVSAQSQPNPQITPAAPGNEKPRRVIRRRVISGQPSPNETGQ